MAHMTETKFGDLQTKEQFKKLERALKLVSLKRSGKGGESLPLAISSSISNINTDAFDSSSNVPSLQASRIGSEVVSSSNNLRNILLRKKRINDGHAIITTSSVKKFDEDSDYQKDRLMMPPPKPSNLLHEHKKLSNKMYSVKAFETECYNSDLDGESSWEKSNYKFPNSSGKYGNRQNLLQTSSDSFQNGNIRTFTKWRVMLNEQIQLIIKGTIECGKVARSKPIAKRLTSTSIESIFKHVYCLQGNIVDDKYELPDYVRGKFYNGFPDDWENVYQVWKTFIQQGSSIMYRWPAPIADSDDDLKSEITDITFAYTENPKNEASKLTSDDSNCTYNILQRGDKQDQRSHSYKRSDSLMQKGISDPTRNLPQESISLWSSMNLYDHDKENNTQQMNTSENGSRTNAEANKLKDKLNVIVNNLTGNNCSSEYITRIIGIFDCLNYVVSHGSIKEGEHSVETLKLQQDTCTVQQEGNEINENSTECTVYKSTALQNSMNSKGGDNKDLIGRKRNFVEMNQDNGNSSSEGESEIYAGIPKISVDRVIRQKGALPRSSKRKIKKKEICQDYGITENPLSRSDCTYESYTKVTRAGRTNCVDINDSSVSITEDENTRSNVDSHFKSGIARRWQLNKSNEFIKDADKSIHEMQEHFVHERSPAIQRSMEYLHDSYDVIESNERETTVCEKDKFNATRTNSHVKSSNERRNEDINVQCHSELSCPRSNSRSTTSKMAKPVAINSVPINIEIRKVNLVEDENIAIKELNEEMEPKNSTRKESPMKVSAIGNQRSEERTKEVQSTNNVDSIVPKRSSRDNIKIAKDNESTDDRKPKLLSAWSPRVLYDSKLHLIFEGRLINDVGHIVQRKFKTDAVLRRVSAKVIETVHHDFYQLVGDLNDAKHAVPKELLSQCAHGCPTRIEQFCRSWHSLKNVESNSSLNNVNVSLSGKGRRRLPALQYWEGERVLLVRDNLIYNAGTCQDSVGISSLTSKRAKQQRKNNSNLDYSDKSENTSTHSAEKLVKKTTEETKKNNSKEFATKSKSRSSQEMLESCHSSIDEKRSLRRKKQEGKAIEQEPANFVHVMAKRDTRSSNIAVSRDIGVGSYTVNSKARKTEARRKSPSKETPGNHRSSDMKYQRKMVCTYYPHIPLKDDVFSDINISDV